MSTSTPQSSPRPAGFNTSPTRAHLDRPSRSASFRVLIGVAASLAFTGCDQSPPPPAATVSTPPDSNVVAIVNGTIIPRQLLQDRLKRSGPGATPQLALEELIRVEATYQKALAAGIDRQPDVQARLKNLIVAQFRERQPRLTNSPSVTEQELRSAYAAQSERFQTPSNVRGAIVFLESPRSATAEKKVEFRQRAEAAWAEAHAAAADERAFAQVVARLSDDRPTRYRGGDTGWMTRDGSGFDQDPALVEALLKLSTPGEFAPLLETSRGFYVARLLEKRPAGRKPFDEVKEALRYQLSRQKAEQAERDFQAAMKSGLDIQINSEALESLSRPAPANEPPPLPGAVTAQLR